MAKNSIRIAVRAVTNRGFELRAYIHTNCSCRIGATLVGEATNMADARTILNRSAHASVGHCSKSKPLLKADAPVTDTLRVGNKDTLGAARRQLVTAAVTAAGGTVEAAPVYIRGTKTIVAYDLTVTTLPAVHKILGTLVDGANDSARAAASNTLSTLTHQGVTGVTRARAVQAARREQLLACTGYVTKAVQHAAA